MSEVMPISVGYEPDPSRSSSLRSDAYTDANWFDADLKSIMARTWQWLCHVEKTREPGSYVTAEIAGNPVAVVRGRDSVLRAFYNVCKHRAHELLSGEETRRGSCARTMHGCTNSTVSSSVRPTPRTFTISTLAPSVWTRFKSRNSADSCSSISTRRPLHCPNSPAISKPRFDIGYRHRATHLWPPADLRHQVKLEERRRQLPRVLPLPDGAQDFCDLVDMDTYKVTTYGIYSSHMADAGNSANSAYDVSNATVKTHAVWWLWPRHA